MFKIVHRVDKQIPSNLQEDFKKVSCEQVHFLVYWWLKPSDVGFVLVNYTIINYKDAALCSWIDFHSLSWASAH